MKKKIRFPGKRPVPGKFVSVPDRMDKVISMTTLWDLDDFIEETEILVEVCKRLRDKRRHNKRCCLNCKSLNTIKFRKCDKCGKRYSLNINSQEEYSRGEKKIKIDDICKAHSIIEDKKVVDCLGKLKFTNDPDRRICIEPRMVKLMETPIEFDYEGDLRVFVCPFMAFTKDDTNIVKYKELQKALKMT